MARRKGKVILAPMLGSFWVELGDDGLYHWKAEFRASKRIFVSKGYKKSYRARIAAEAKGMKPRFDADGEVVAKPALETV